MLDIKNLKDDFSIQQINQLIKIYERGYDITYLDNELLTIPRLRLFLKDIDKYDGAQKSLIKYGIDNKYNIFLYSNSFFSEKQMEMIIIGIEKELDVTHYADPKFNLIQMREIYQLLEYNKVKNKNIDISRIAKARYSAGQMHQIKDGLIKNLDVSIYEKTEFTPEQMQLIKIGLEKGYDVSKYANPDLSIEEMAKILNTEPKPHWYARMTKKWGI